jgi:hypothetical protein
VEAHSRENSHFPRENAELLREFYCLLAGRINASAGVVLVFGGQHEAQLSGGQVLADPAFAKFLKDSKD